MILKFLNSYNYASYKDFVLSLFPSWKYGMGAGAVSSSAIITWFADVMGVTPLIVGVMLLVIFVETVSGLYASHKLNITFESLKFSRCVLKLFIWVVLLFALHAFAKDMALYQGWVYSVAAWMLSTFHALMMVYFCVENTTSILENLAVIDGKDKATYINAMRDMFTEAINFLKNNINRKR